MSLTPAPLIGIIALVSLCTWALCAIPLRTHPRLLAPAALSYVLGLRHGLDADHISAIDLATRRLIAAGQRPVAVGTFFSLGHSTVVVFTCIAVAATSGALRDDPRWEGMRTWGGIVGSAVSAVFLVVLCGANGWVLHGLVKKLRGRLNAGVDAEAYVSVDADSGANVGMNMYQPAPGFLGGVFRKLFTLVDASWKMLPLGMLFGLGFDTSSEIAILGLATVHAVEGTSIWLILIFPALFTAGMCLVDTADGALMMALYTSKAFSRDPIIILYYSIVLTAITVGVAAFIGAVQILTLARTLLGPDDDGNGSAFWDWVDAVGDHFDVIGACICGVFALVGIGSMVVYRPWRRRVEGARPGEGPDERSRLLQQDTE